MNANASKHTPGPWEAIPAKNEYGEETISIRGNAEFIASMDTRSIDGGPYNMPPQGYANARLIAAAPDLLDALAGLLGACRDAYKREGIKGDSVAILAAAVEAQVAIRRATEG